MEIEILPAGENDGDFVYRVKHQALGPLIESKWGWHEEFQRALHDKDWQKKPWSIILADGVAIGTVSVDRREKTVRLSGFYLLPDHQGQGLGSQVLARILYQCDKDQRDCSVNLLTGNRAYSLFKRHGFRETGSDALHTSLLRNWRYP